MSVEARKIHRLIALRRFVLLAWRG